MELKIAPAVKNSDAHIRQLWMKEARRRIDDVRGGRVKTISGEDAFAQVHAAVEGCSSCNSR